MHVMAAAVDTGRSRMRDILKQHTFHHFKTHPVQELSDDDADR